MQFREFGRWIARLSIGTERYLVFAHMTTANEIVELAAQAGLSDRIKVFRCTGVAKEFAYVIATEGSPGDVTIETKPLVEALQSFVRVAGHQPDEREYEDDAEPGATHPDGESDPFSFLRWVHQTDEFIRGLFEMSG